MAEMQIVGLVQHWATGKWHKIVVSSRVVAAGATKEMDEFERYQIN